MRWLPLLIICLGCEVGLRTDNPNPRYSGMKFDFITLATQVTPFPIGIQYWQPASFAPPEATYGAVGVAGYDWRAYDSENLRQFLSVRVTLKERRDRPDPHSFEIFLLDRPVSQPYIDPSTGNAYYDKANDFVKVGEVEVDDWGAWLGAGTTTQISLEPEPFFDLLSDPDWDGYVVLALRGTNTVDIANYYEVETADFELIGIYEESFMIDSYAKLQTEIQAYLVNDDLDDTRTEELISLAEARFDREIRTRDMYVSLTGDVPADGLIALPSGYLEMAQLSIVKGSRSYELQYAPMHVLPNLSTEEAAGEPYWYTIEGTNIRVSPVPGDGTTYDYTLGYYSEVPKLSDSNTSNWLLAIAPDIYLYGALVESAPFFEDDERMPVWEALYARGKASLKALNMRSRYQPGGRIRSYATSHYEGRRRYPGSR